MNGNMYGEKIKSIATMFPKPPKLPLKLVE